MCVGRASRLATSLRARGRGVWAFFVGTQPILTTNRRRSPRHRSQWPSRHPLRWWQLLPHTHTHTIQRSWLVILGSTGCGLQAADGAAAPAAHHDAAGQAEEHRAADQPPAAVAGRVVSQQHAPRLQAHQLGVAGEVAAALQAPVGVGRGLRVVRDRRASACASAVCITPRSKIPPTTRLI